MTRISQQENADINLHLDVKKIHPYNALKSGHPNHEVTLLVRERINEFYALSFTPSLTHSGQGPNSIPDGSLRLTRQFMHSVVDGMLPVKVSKFAAILICHYLRRSLYATKGKVDIIAALRAQSVKELCREGKTHQQPGALGDKTNPEHFAPASLASDLQTCTSMSRT